MPGIHIKTDDAVKKLEEEALAGLAKESETSPSSPAEEETKTSEETVTESESTEKSEKPAEDSADKSEKTVPYARLKEVIDERNDLKKRIADLESAFNPVQEVPVAPVLDQSQPNFAEMQADEFADYTANLAVQKARTAYIQEQEVERQKTEALRAYPELDRNNQAYRPEFEEAVAGIIVANRQANPHNPNMWLSAKQAADRVANGIGNYFKTRGEQAALNEVKDKVSANGTPTSGRGNQLSPQEMSLEELEKTLPKTDNYFKSVATRF